MAALYHVLCFVVFVSSTLTEPTPGRIPKVYNALITSNQNLEPSKAFPVYQPVLQNTLPFPYQPVLYGDFPLTSGLLPPPVLPSLPKESNAKSDEPVTPPVATGDAAPSTPTRSEQPPPDEIKHDADKPVEADKDAALAPPTTESPIPVNEFGLPPQLVPLGRVNPDYGLTQFNSFPYPYSYPGFRFYDPFLSFGYNPYPSYPIYRPLNNFVAQYSPKAGIEEVVITPAPATDVADKSAPVPPAEPSDLNALNYASKDPAIPNVPPPPLPQGGLKTDKE